MTILPVLLLLAGALPQEAPPGDLAGWIRRQDAMVEGGAAARAVAEAAARAEREPKSAEALYLHGRILGNTGDVEGARARFRAALEIDPDYPPAWRGMSLVHMREKDFETAVREARRAYELEESPENRVLLVQALYEKGDRPGAYRILKEALARAPGDDDLRIFYASRLLNEGLFRDAEREIRQVLASAPAHLAARQMLVMVLVQTGRREEAAAECREFIRLSPRDARARVLLRDILVGRKDLAGAAAVMEEVLRLDLSPEFRAEAERDLRTLRAAADRPAPPPGESAPAGPPDEGDILRRLESRDVRERRDAMATLSGHRLNYLPGALLRRAGDEDETVRLQAVRLIGTYGEPAHLGLLDVLLFRTRQRDPSTAVRARAIQAVGRIGSPAGLLLLHRGLEEPEPEVLGAVVRAVRDLTGKCLVEDPDAPIPAAEAAAVRERAARWWLGDPTAKQWRRKAAAAVAEGGLRDLAWYLVPWIGEDDPAMRGEALGALAALSGDPSWTGLPTGTEAERGAARDRAYGWLAEKDREASGADGTAAGTGGDAPPGDGAGPGPGGK